jgi:hypothetical protein
MKRTFLFQLAISTLFIFTQALTTGDVQAIARNSNRYITKNHSVSPQISLLRGDPVKKSTPRLLSLARHLAQIGAILYGSSSCGYVKHQLSLFGPEAASLLKYVECDGEANIERCEAAGISSTPTWELNGEKKMGIQLTEELESWSGFSMEK